MNELMKFLKKSQKKLVKVDYETLVNTANQIEALKKEKDKNKKAAVKQAINRNLDGLGIVAKSKHYSSAEYSSLYVNVNNRLILQEAIGIARKLLREV